MSQVLPKDVPQTLRKWKRYPAYKDSEVEWLGEIPKDWRVLTVRNLIRSEYLEIQDGNHGEIHPRAEEYVETGIPFVMANNIRNGKIDLEGCKYISEQQAKSLRIGFSESGDVLLIHKGTIGETAIVPKIIKFEFIMLTPQVTYYRLKNHEINRNFLFCYFQSKSFQERLKFIASNQSTRDYVGLVAQKDFEIVLPSLNEQKAIASFLDRETAKIDALIAKKERLIELLQEKRTAIISHAVTKGLNPTVQMKDSGVEWLGKIPTHWEKTRIKYALHQIIDTEHKTAPSYPDGEYLIVRTSNVRNGQLVFDDAKYTDHEGFREWTKRGKPEPGDILFTREAPAGEACLVPENLSLCLGQRMVLFRVNHQMLDENYGIRSLYGGIAAEFISSLSQGSTVAHFNMADIGNIPLLLPPLEEQAAIASYLDRETAKIDALIAKIREGIEKLKEYRTALISAAVTGKIDVRNEVAS